MLIKRITAKTAAFNYQLKIQRKFWVIASILLLVSMGSLFCAGFTTKNTGPANYGNGAFAGSGSCKSCHASIYESHLTTAHYLTSRPAAAQFIKGSFEAPKNKFAFNKLMAVVMDKTDSGFYQSAYINGMAYQSAPFDIVIGSGRKGQTYLYWVDNQLFQLPVSYYTPLDSWCNSPGFSAGFINFNRPIPARCLECHGTYAKAQEDSTATLFDRQSILYGIDCERCHGPSAQHVAYHQAHTDDTFAKFVVSAKRLPRQQRLDACALCHSRYRRQVQPTFSYGVGDDLEKYSLPTYKTDSTSGLDVHGNQYGLLTSSKCFMQSAEMDCSSCHNVHNNEVNSPQLYSTRCMACHNDAAHNNCTLPAMEGLTKADNCVDCHMPLLPSKKIFLQLADAKKSTPDLVRTHHVGIYPEQTKLFLAKIKKGM